MASPGRSAPWPSEDEGVRTRTVLELIAVVIAPLSVVSALLLYFGWVRTVAVFAHFGIDQSMLRFTPIDYLLRSAEVVFRPSVVLLLATACCVGASRGMDGLLWQTGNRHGWRRRLSVTLGIFALLLLAASLAGFLGWVPPIVAAPAFGLAAVAAYGAYRMYFDSRSRGLHQVRVGTPVVLLTLACSLLVSVFWTATVYAERSGSQLADDIASGASPRPSAVIYSRTPLALPREETTGYAMGATERPYLYRYSDFRVLAYSGDRWFLIRETWTADSTTVVLRDDDSIRVELVPDRQ